ncbi:Aste57867_23317 [Aphanomyces stellatus]|uniref:Aste57867_23317 protein n=1 Tax=Aphanomyces stellatus TaxID=120398 RepID=A0A485LMK6_9STRA|nr:hypothetical protein As57867_023246 [Aphanomyces stellatus]VFT99962.1 Aste57867_23317 [Aphanomyces stellatus]
MGNQVPRPPPPAPVAIIHTVPTPPASNDTATDEEIERKIEDELALYNAPKTSTDDYELLKVIGKGSSGKVTLVRKKDNNKLYAMKMLSKINVNHRNPVEHTRSMRRFQSVAKHPYIVHLHYAFQTKQKLYFVIDYCPGGELFFHLSRMERFPETMACFYAAEITLALDHLHQSGVVYRDLKPENLLFDSVGHVLLGTSSCLSPFFEFHLLFSADVSVPDKGTNSMYGTPEYLAPEILDRVGHGTSVDWWALGMVLYEMLTGLPPWYSRNRQKMFDRVRHAPLTFPDYVSPNAQSLIAGLLNRIPVERLGNASANDIKTHPFFASIKWDDLKARKLVAPFHPTLNTGDETFEVPKMQLHSVVGSSKSVDEVSKTAGTQPNVPTNGRGRALLHVGTAPSTITHDNVNDEAELDRYKRDFWLDPHEVVHSRSLPSTFFKATLGHYLGQPVYIKSLDLSSADLARHKAALVHKVHTLVACAQHANLVNFIGFCVSDEHGLCCVSEYMEGKSVRHVLNDTRQSLSWQKEKIQIAMDIAAASVYLHSLRPRIICYHVKAAKVLLTARRVAKLSIRGRLFSQDRSFQDMGDIEWSAPELLVDGATCDEKVDVYSFGVFLTELDTRQLPFAAQVATVPRTEISKQIVQGTLRPALSKTCPPCIQQIVDQCFKSDASLRPSSERVLHMLRDARLELLESV